VRRIKGLDITRTYYAEYVIKELEYARKEGLKEAHLTLVKIPAKTCEKLSTFKSYNIIGLYIKLYHLRLIPDLIPFPSSLPCRG